MRVSTGVDGLGMLGLPTTMGSFGAGVWVSSGVEFTAIPRPVVESTATSGPFGAAKLDPSAPSPLAAPSSGHLALCAKAWAQDYSDGSMITVPLCSKYQGIYYMVGVLSLEDLHPRTTSGI